MIYFYFVSDDDDYRLYCLIRFLLPVTGHTFKAQFPDWKSI